MKKYTLEQIIDLLNAEFPKGSDVFTYYNLEKFAYKHDCIFDSGETRWCIFQPHWKEVIKLPRFDNVDDDYCEIELNNYNEACVLGIERILLACRKICVLDCGCPAYAQIKFTCSHRNLNRKATNDLCDCTDQVFKGKIVHAARHGMYDYSRINERWFARAYQIYGKRFMRVLEDFTKRNQIGDLHSSNIGWLGNQPIILDYAGYYG